MLKSIATLVFVAALPGSVLTAQGRLLGFEDCWFSAQTPTNVGLGQQLAQADRLDNAALEYDEFPYEQCYRLGRSCAQLSIEVDEAAFDTAHSECRFVYPDLNVKGYEVWRAQRSEYNECMATILRREALEIRAAIFQEGEAQPSLADVMRGEATTLGSNEVNTISTDVTWCPSEDSNFLVAISCTGGGLVIGTSQGESRLTHRVSPDGYLCLSDFISPETCHRVVRDGDALTLEPLHAIVNGPFTTVEGVEGRGTWNHTCTAN